jgi:uncharacterized repeat protein (TIGR01451 family)
MYRPAPHRISKHFSLPFTLAATTIIAVVILFAPAATAQIAFETPFEQTGLTPETTISADMNQDGIADIVTANGCSGCDPSIGVDSFNSVSVLLGNGDGRFRSKLSFPVGVQPLDVAVGDFNHDGVLDVVSANTGTNTVSVLLGRRDGSLLPHTDFVVGNHPTRVLTSDVNRDGKLDIVALTSDPNTGAVAISVLLGRGNGTFAAHLDSPASSRTRDITIADFNGDGIPDVAAAGEAVNVMFGTGGGHFNTGLVLGAAEPGTSNGYFGVAVLDANLDGKPDIAANFLLDLDTGGEANRLVVFLNAGGGHFNTVFTPVDSQADVTGRITIAKFNADAIPDIISGGMLLLGNGDGTFRATATDFLAPRVAADFNRDGKTDLVLTNNNFLQTVLGNGDGTFHPAKPLSNIAGLGGWFAAGHFNDNGTGLPDIVSTSSVQLGQGSATVFGAPIPLNLGTACVRANSGAIADFNGDHLQDLAVSCSGDTPQANVVVILLGKGNGTFGAAKPFATGASTTNRGFPVQLVATDLNGDGVPDLAVTNSFENTISILLNNGTGSFTLKSKFASGGSGPISPSVRDFNRDGKADLVVVNTFFPGNVTLFTGNGDGTFRTPGTLITSGQVAQVASADFNRDNIQDLAVSVPDPGLVELFFGNGDGSFTHRADLKPRGSFFDSISATDFNADGIVDLAVGGASIFLGNGDGTFKPRIDVFGGGGVLTWGDFNRDGLFDIAGTGLNRGASDVSVHVAGPTTAVKAGATVTYKVTVRNNGPNPATEVIVSDTLPPSIKFVSATSSQGFCQGIVTGTCNLGTIATGAQLTVTITGRTSKAATISNTVTATAFGVDPNKSNNAAAATVTVVP